LEEEQVDARRHRPHIPSAGLRDRRVLRDLRRALLEYESFLDVGILSPGGHPVALCRRGALVMVFTEPLDRW